MTRKQYKSDDGAIKIPENSSGEASIESLEEDKEEFIFNIQLETKEEDVVKLLDQI